MELFYSREISHGRALLDPQESAHCVKVLRHRCGDEIFVIDGLGTLMRCRLTSDSPRGAEAEILSEERGWGGHGYDLTLGVCPTKNIDRFEWFAEKATEIGLDTLVPLEGDHSERKVVKGERMEKVLVSAAKQSLKAKVPSLGEMMTVKDFIRGHAEGLRLIACCFDDCPRTSIREALEASGETKITILIGPEGDFSKEEVRLAVDAGFIPVQIGQSRLRTETAAVMAAAAVYFRFM